MPDGTLDGDTLLPFSPHAGLFLLVQAIHRLSIDRLCEADPFLPLRLLHATADRLGIAGDDPARLALPERPDPLPEPAHWLAPTAWLDLLPGRGAAPPATVLRPHGDGFAITDSALRIVLGRAVSAEPLLARFGPAPLRRAAAAAPAERPVLLRSCQLALGRYLRRAARTSLRRLVRRPGRVVASRTHVDLLFTHDQAEIGPRRAGLDLDPGWVPWLGRVVSVHYLDPEEFAG